MHKIFLGIFVATLSIMVGVVSCTQKPDVSNAESIYKPVATLQELMVSIVDPNIDPIWNSVSTVITKAGTEEKRPKTDEEWQILKNHALALIEVSNLLVMEGRQVAAPGASTSTTSAESSPEVIQKTINANRDDFVKRAHALQDSAKLALTAINAKNPEELTTVGGIIDHACEQCHKQFWYPNDKAPIK